MAIEILNLRAHFYSIYPKCYTLTQESGAPILIAAGFIINDVEVKGEEMIKDPANGNSFNINQAGLLTHNPKTNIALFTSISML